MEKMTPQPKDMPTVVVTTREQLKSLIKETIDLYGPECDLNFIDVSQVTNMTAIFDHSVFNGRTPPTLFGWGYGFTLRSVSIPKIIYKHRRQWHYIIKNNVLGIRKHNTAFISRHDKLLFQNQFLLRSCLRHHRAVPACANP